MTHQRMLIAPDPMMLVKLKKNESAAPQGLPTTTDPVHRMKEDKRARIGWREYVEIPELGILGTNRIKAKIDSGARSCALHAINIRYFQKDDAAWIAFDVHPRQRNTKSLVSCQAPLLEVRSVKDSGGKRTLRPVILTDVKIGSTLIPIELTLVARDSMGFRMLIGRQAIRGRYLIDPGSSFILSPKKHAQKKLKKKKHRIPFT